MPKIKFNEQTYTALHTSATANKVLGVKQPKQKKAEKKARKTYTFSPPCLQLMPRYTFCCFECAYQKTHKALTCIQKKREKLKGLGLEW